MEQYFVDYVSYIVLSFHLSREDVSNNFCVFCVKRVSPYYDVIMTSLHFVIERCLKQMHCLNLFLFSYHFCSETYVSVWYFYEMYVHIYMCACINVYV